MVWSAGSAIEAMRQGARDELLEPIDLQRWTARSPSSVLVQQVAVGGVPDDRASQDSAVNRQTRTGREVGLELSVTGEG